MWLLLDGTIDHVTLTSSFLAIQNKNDPLGTTQPKFQVRIADSEASARYPIFNTQASLFQEQFGIHVVTSDEVLQFSGDAGAFVIVRYLEWIP